MKARTGWFWPHSMCVCRNPGSVSSPNPCSPHLQSLSWPPASLVPHNAVQIRNHLDVLLCDGVVCIASSKKTEEKNKIERKEKNGVGRLRNSTTLFYLRKGINKINLWTYCKSSVLPTYKPWGITTIESGKQIEETNTPAWQCQPVESSFISTTRKYNFISVILNWRPLCSNSKPIQLPRSSKEKLTYWPSLDLLELVHFSGGSCRSTVKPR